MRGNMKQLLGVVVLVLAVVATGCSASPPRSPEATGEPADENTEGSDEPGEPVADIGCEDLPPGTDFYSGRRNSPVLNDASGKVPSEANIFGAGMDAPPAPGGGGGGVLPPVLLLPEGTSRVRVTSATGRVNPISMYPDWNGAAGDGIGPTDVKSFLGISGIVHRTNGMFLVGVFLTDAPPSGPAPPRFDFSTTTITADESEELITANEEEFGLLAPEIGQSFLIGDGKGRSYTVPAEATRLFLGFADAFLYEGCPGWYGNNLGHLNVTVDVTAG